MDRKIFILGDIQGDYKPVRDFCMHMNSAYDESQKIHGGDTIERKCL